MRCCASESAERISRLSFSRLPRWRTTQSVESRAAEMTPITTERPTTCEEVKRCADAPIASASTCAQTGQARCDDCSARSAKTLQYVPKTNAFALRSQGREQTHFSACLRADGVSVHVRDPPPGRAGCAFISDILGMSPSFNVPHHDKTSHFRGKRRASEATRSSLKTILRKGSSGRERPKNKAPAFVNAGAHHIVDGYRRRNQYL